MNAWQWFAAGLAMFGLALEAPQLLAGEPTPGTPAKPENLARAAQASASTSYSGQYLAQFACDGQVPAPGSAADIGKAWAARGNDHPEGVAFTLQWPEPVTIAEVVYYGRTAFAASENWKDFEIRLDDALAVVLKGTLVGGHGPQRMSLPEAATARKLTIRFTSSWGGPNPGASEIEVYATRPAEAALGAFIPANKLLMDGSGPPAAAHGRGIGPAGPSTEGRPIWLYKNGCRPAASYRCFARLHLSLRGPAGRRRPVRVRRSRR